MSARRVIIEAYDVRQTELDLLRSVGHELKAPLTHISGVVNMLRRGEFDEDQAPEQLLRLELSSQRMLGLIDSLLYAGRVETRQIALNFEPINVSAVVHEVVQSNRPLALRYHHDIRTIITHELAPAATDRQALTYALNGLLDVIIRSSKSEVIEILVHHQEKDIMITVRDDGEHLPAGSLKSILRRLGNTAQPVKQLPGSAGLSMYVAAVLADALDGVFQIQQIKGKRAISFTVPLSQQMELAV